MQNVIKTLLWSVESTQSTSPRVIDANGPVPLVGVDDPFKPW